MTRKRAGLDVTSERIGTEKIGRSDCLEDNGDCESEDVGDVNKPIKSGRELQMKYKIVTATVRR